MVDIQIVKGKLSLLNENVLYLKSKQKTISLKELKNKFELVLSISRAIQIAIQSCIDISTHIASDEGWQLPSSASHGFQVLLRHHVIKSSTCEEFEEAAKLRNILVHQYDELDLEVIVNVVKSKLNHFDNFRDEIEQWLKTEKK